MKITEEELEETKNQVKREKMGSEKWNTVLKLSRTYQIGVQKIKEHEKYD